MGLTVAAGALLSVAEGLASSLFVVVSLVVLLGGVEALSDFRLSVMYQPLPLKMTPTGWNTRRTGPFPHTSHSVSGSAVKGCTLSKREPHDLHSYSYTGIFSSLEHIIN